MNIVLLLYGYFKLHLLIFALPIFKSKNPTKDIFIFTDILNLGFEPLYFLRFLVMIIMILYGLFGTVLPFNHLNQNSGTFTTRPNHLPIKLQLSYVLPIESYLNCTPLSYSIDFDCGKVLLIQQDTLSQNLILVLIGGLHPGLFGIKQNLIKIIW